MTAESDHPQAGSATTSSPESFSAFVVERNGDSVDQGVRRLSTDDLPAGDVLIRVDWSALNYKDGMVAQPGNRVARISPLVPGVDLVGTVVAGGEEPDGQPVIVHGYDLGVAHHGGFAEYARVPADWVVPLPDGLTPRRAAIIGTAGFTAALSLRRLEIQGLTPDQGPVLVTGASGGVGSMSVALLASRGYQVVASTGKDHEHPYLTGLGASEVIGRDLGADPTRVLGAERWAGAIDCVGGQTLAAVLRTLRYGGGVAASGLTGGNALETSVYPFIVRGVALLGVDSVQTPIAERREVWSRLADGFDAALLDEMAADEIGLQQLPDALSTIMAGGVRGRILVRPSS
ncbi:MAG TPA: acryloyl-CoA reductase [Acidimicrobiales bacterium]|jgi:putative YhdH/YhfP family quinone oxidoreductase|nr:acryloyl-CoA reductase [Acidimicrobiales bacterium]